MSRAGKRIVFWAVSIAVVGLMAAFVFSNRTGSERVIQSAEQKLAEKKVEGIIRAKFTGFVWRGGLAYQYAIMKDQTVLLRSVYHPLTGKVEMTDR